MDEWVLLKVQNFLGKNRKLAETFKGPYQITKVNENGTIKIKTKFGKHEQLVNQNLLVKYKQARPEEKEKATQGNEAEILTGNPENKRKYQKRTFPSREDGGPITRAQAAKLKAKDAKTFDLINNLELRNPIGTFKKLIKRENNEKAIQKRLQLANFSKQIIFFFFFFF